MRRDLLVIPPILNRILVLVGPMTPLELNDFDRPLAVRRGLFFNRSSARLDNLLLDGILFCSENILLIFSWKLAEFRI